MSDVPPPMDRRAFLVAMAAGSLGVSGAFSLYTVLTAVQAPARSIEGKTRVGALAIGKVTDLKPETPVLAEYGDDVVFLIKTKEDEILVLDAACPHVRCKLGFNAQTKEFDCPCHASSFTLTGKKLGGPAPRDMIPAKFVVQKGEIVVSGFEV